MSVLAGGDTVNRDSGLITIVGSFALDHIHREDEPGVSLPGGPARFLAETLESFGRRVTIVTGIVAEVAVTVGPHGEEYDIRRLPVIPLPDSLPGNTIVSPIMREIDAARVPPVGGFLALDVQGFVRRPRDEPDLDPDPALPDLIARSSAVKVGHNELSQLSAAARQALDQTVALITHGDADLELRIRAVSHRVPVVPAKIPNPIGAGDVLLAAYTDGSLRGLGPLEAAESAVHHTSSVLRQRAATD